MQDIERFARVYYRYCRNVFINFLNVHLGPYHALPAALNTKFTDHLKQNKKKKMIEQSEPYHADK